MINCAYCSLEVSDTLPQCPYCGNHLTWYAVRCEGAEGTQNDVIGVPGNKEGCGLLVCLFGWMLTDDNEEGKFGSVFWTCQEEPAIAHCATCGNAMQWYLAQTEHVGATPGEAIQNGAMERETVTESDCLPGCGPQTEHVGEWYVTQTEYVGATPGEAIQNGAMERETVTESDCCPCCGPLCCIVECCFECCLEMALE